MLGIRSAAGFVLALGLLALAGTTHAGDTFRLDMPGPGRTPAVTPAPGAADTRTLDTSSQTDDDLMTVGYRGGFYGGGHRGGFYGGGHHGGGHHGGFYGGGHYGGGYRGGFYGGGYRGFVGGYYGGGFYRGGYGYGGYRGYYGGYPRYGYGFGYGSYPRVYGYSSYSSYYSPYSYGYGGYCSPYTYSYSSYYSPSVCYSYPSCYVNPCSLSSAAPVISTIPTMPPATTLNITPTPSVDGQLLESTPSTTPLPSPSSPGTTVQPDAGTFPYDGGPKEITPMPRAEEIPTAARTYDMVIRPARLVSLPETPASASKTGKWTFPAYGEEAKRSSSR